MENIDRLVKHWSFCGLSKGRNYIEIFFKSNYCTHWREVHKKRPLLEHFTPIENLLKQKSDDMQKSYLSVSRLLVHVEWRRNTEKNQLQSSMLEHNPLCRFLLITVQAHERTGINRCWTLLKAFNVASQWTLMELAFLESQLDCQGNHITKGCRMEGYRHLLKSSMGLTKLNETGCPRKQFSHSSCLLAGFHSITETFLQEFINFHILGPGELPMLLRIGRFFEYRPRGEL